MHVLDNGTRPENASWSPGGARPVLIGGRGTVRRGATVRGKLSRLSFRADHAVVDRVPERYAATFALTAVVRYSADELTEGVHNQSWR